MIIQFHAPSVLLQCCECKHLERCSHGKHNPSASMCRTGEATKKALLAAKKLQGQLDSRENMIVPLPR